MTNNSTKSNNKKDYDKQKQFRKIIEVGRRLFISKGSYGFTTRALAKKCGMSQPNLYTYVTSKRELWIAIRNEDWRKFIAELEETIKKHQGSFSELFEKLGIYFLDFVKREYQRFQMMFLIPPPPSSKIGPIEENYELINPLNIVKRVIQEAIEKKEIKPVNVDYYTYYFVGFLYGMAFIEREFRFVTPITEPIEVKPSPEYIKNFRKFVLEKYRAQINELKR